MQAVSSRMKSSYHTISTGTVTVMTRFMDDIVELFRYNAEPDPIDPELYLKQSDKYNVYE